MDAHADAHEQIAGRARVWRARLVPLALVVVAAALVVVVARLPGKVEPLPDNGVAPTNVIVETVRPLSELADTFTLSAIVEPECVVCVAAEVSGRIERYAQRHAAVNWRGRVLAAGEPIDEGEPIAKGDPIVYLNTDLLQARFDQAQAQFEYDQSEYDRIADLFERGVTSKTEFDNARTTRSVSKAALDEAARNLERAQITAPISGVLNRLPMEIGEYASPGAQVAEIVSDDRVKAVVEVPERDIYYLSLGDTAEVLVDALEQTRLTGAISYISELADELTRTTRIEILVDNRDRRLRSGQIVRARLTRRVLTDVIMIPLGSVIPLEQGRVVYVVNDGHAERREVELGLIEGRSVEILSGLAGGDRLIVAGHRYVGPGQPVTVVETQGPDQRRDAGAPAASAAGQEPRAGKPAEHPVASGSDTP